MAAGRTRPPCHPSTCEYTTGGAARPAAAGLVVAGRISGLPAAGRSAAGVPEPPPLTAITTTTMTTSVTATASAASTFRRAGRSVRQRDDALGSAGLTRFLPPVHDSGAGPLGQAR